MGNDIHIEAWLRDVSWCPDPYNQREYFAKYVLGLEGQSAWVCRKRDGRLVGFLGPEEYSRLHVLIIGDAPFHIDLGISKPSDKIVSVVIQLDEEDIGPAFKRGKARLARVEAAAEEAAFAKREARAARRAFAKAVCSSAGRTTRSLLALAFKASGKALSFTRRSIGRYWAWIVSRTQA